MVLSKIKNQKGVSLIYIVLIMIVVSILSLAIFTLFVSNMNQAKMQQDSIKAHYIAVAGVDVTFAGLTKGTSANRLLTTYFDKPINQYPLGPLTTVVNLENGTANVTVKGILEEEKRWVVISSVATITGSDVTQKVEMRVRVEYHEIQEWN